MGEEVAAILGLDGNGERLMPLVHAECRSEEARERVKATKVAPLVRAGLYVYFDCWDEAHTVAQDIESAEGSYWHAIVHRQEPDASNAGYWFRRVGEHAIFPTLLARAREIGLPVGSRWDPMAFVEYCGRAKAGSREEEVAQQVQLAEWQLLMEWCGR
jgi:hypothetical protein